MSTFPDYGSMGRIQLRSEQRRWETRRYEAANEGNRSAVKTAKRHLNAISAALIAEEEAAEERAANGRFGVGA